MKEIKINNNVPSKTPEEIKKWMECCSIIPPKCNECPANIKNSLCDISMLRCTLAYIQQLERERDAAINELRGYGCKQCAHSDLKNIATICRNCELGSLWQWHGLKEE